MALTPSNQHEVFIREVDDAYREDQVRGFIASYGKWLLGLVALIVAAYATYLGVQHFRSEDAGQAGEQFTQALDAAQQNRVPDARKQFDAIAASQQGSYRAAALIANADLALMSNDLKDATAKFGQVATDPKAPDIYRNLALVRSITANYDSLQPQEVIARLSPIAKPGQPYYPNAAELVALAQIKLGQTQPALSLLQGIAAAPDAPETLKNRAGQMVSMLSSGAATAPATEAATPTTPAAAPVAAKKGGDTK